MKSFEDFRIAALDHVSESVKETSSTPPPHFLRQNHAGGFVLVGPIWQDDAEKRDAPRLMKTWIREQRPEQIAFVKETFQVSNPTEADLLIRPSEHPRRRHLVSAWFFRRGSRQSEVWEADVLKDDDGRVRLGEWRALDPKEFDWSGELFDPVLEAMSEKTPGWRRLLGL